MHKSVLLHISPGQRALKKNKREARVKKGGSSQLCCSCWYVLEASNKGDKARCWHQRLITEFLLNADAMDVHHAVHWPVSRRQPLKYLMCAMLSKPREGDLYWEKRGLAWGFKFSLRDFPGDPVVKNSPCF